MYTLVVFYNKNIFEAKVIVHYCELVNIVCFKRPPLHLEDAKSTVGRREALNSSWQEAN